MGLPKEIADVHLCRHRSCLGPVGPPYLGHPGVAFTPYFPICPATHLPEVGESATMTGVQGIFTDPGAVVRAVQDLRRAGFRDVTVFLPVPDPTVLAVLDERPSPVRLWTLVGGLLGCLSGFALTIGTSLDWPIPTGGKPIVAIPPFIVIAFEGTVLLGALGTLVGFLFHSRLPRRAVLTTYDPRLAEDHFGVFVGCPSDRRSVVRAILQNAGAEEVSDIGLPGLGRR